MINNNFVTVFKGLKMINVDLIIEKAGHAFSKKRQKIAQERKTRRALVSFFRRGGFPSVIDYIINNPALVNEQDVEALALHIQHGGPLLDRRSEVINTRSPAVSL